ncbi:hypothetical protein CASP1_00019 [Alcaligenes phage CASP1]|nr:hypothetical protein CASP1_00019 [Alcaligenes phage CASP1]
MTVKRYDLGREILAYSGVSTMGIVECPGGKYVRIEDYLRAKEELKEFEEWIKPRLAEVDFEEFLKTKKQL